MTVAAFMDAALYHPRFGYYARTAQRSGRAGDFFTSVDVGPLFGELLAVQAAQMFELLDAERWDLIEAGAGNGRLSTDILRAMRTTSPRAYDGARLYLVETSAAARDAQRETLGECADRLVESAAAPPDSFEGVLIANELLDAMPVHQVVMREDGLREIYVEAIAGAFVTREGPVSTPRLPEYFAASGITLETGWRAEVSLTAVDWIRDTMRRLSRGFAIIIDYGHEAAELYSATHSAGTLTTFSRHTAAGAETSASELSPAWLRHPGDQDLTAHVDFTTIRSTAEAEGARTLGFLDQMYFLMALGADRFSTLDLKQRLALKTLIMPGGLGSTMKVLIFGKNVGSPALIGCSSHMRVT